MAAGPTQAAKVVQNPKNKRTTPGKLDQADVTALNKYIKKLSAATAKPPPKTATAAQVKTYNDRLQKLQAYKGRRSSYIERIEKRGTKGQKT